VLDTFTQYTTTRKFTGPLPSWMSDEDGERVQAYSFYEQIYRNVPEAFKLTQRGADSDPVYLPSARGIVESVNRFLARGWNYAIDPAFDTPENQVLVRQKLSVLFARERMRSKFNMQKRWGLIRGDSIWHVIADPTRPENRRISIYDVDPATYFPIEDLNNPGRLLGVHLVTQTVDPKDPTKTVIRRRTYRKQDTGVITSELSLWEMGGWDDRDESTELKLVAVLEPEIALPALITTLPVYHVTNSRAPESLFGVSELAGIENVLAAVNQTISDEHLTLVMQGLGMYVTNAGPPVDPTTGEELNWVLGPGRVVEIGDEKTFENVAGVRTVSPMIEHMKFMLEQTYEAIGLPDVARGRVDVTAAESGIALLLQLGPLLAAAEEKEDEMLGVYDQLLYDLVYKWLPSYEGLPITEIVIASTVDDPLPDNRKQRIEEIIMLMSSTPPLISAEYARQELTKLGYDFPAEMGETVVTEQAAYSSAVGLDPFASRVAEDLERERAATGGTGA